jgi:DNA primase
VTAFAGRVLAKVEGVAKYLNSPNHLYITKDAFYTGYHTAKTISES